MSLYYKTNKVISINQLNYKAPDKSHATDQLACCSQHTLYITMRLFMRKSYEAGAEMLPRRACDMLSVHLGGIEKNGSCSVRYSHTL